MKVNRRAYDSLVDEIYDLLLGKDGEYVIYVSPAMCAYIRMIQSYKIVANNYVATILGFPVLAKTGLQGKKFEVIKND